MVGWNPFQRAAVSEDWHSLGAARRKFVSVCALVFMAAASQLSAKEVLVGHLSIVFGDPMPRSAALAVRLLTVADEDGKVTELHVSDELWAAAGGFYAWNGQRVEITLRAPGAEVPGLDLRPGTRQVAAITLVGDSASGGHAEAFQVSGSHPWVSILCKFSDIDAEPRDLAYFQGMYANVSGGLDDYWREVSYDNIDIVGSTAVDWVTLPGSQTSYVPTPGIGNNVNLSALFNDCTDAADPFVDFSIGGSGGFSGINMMFNANLDCCAWGGSRFASLDGVSKSWRTTWNPPWSFSNSAVIAHEMGHGFGLPHANNWDQDNSPYDSPWDVMSSAGSGYSTVDPTYGRLGQHINMYHKDWLNWVAPARLLEVQDDQIVTATIDASAFQGSSNYYMARLPIPGSSRHYTVEVRKRIGSYDGNLPGNVVIIHEVASGRSEPSWSYDAAVPPANYAANEGTMWRVGETFEDAGENIRIAIDSETANGFVITINRNPDAAPLQFGSSFE